MQKLAAVSVLGTVLAAGLPVNAIAVDAATVVCGIVSSTSTSPTGQIVLLSQANSGVAVPPSCTATAISSCSQCISDLLSNGFKLVNSFSFTSSASYFVLRRGGD